MEQPTILHTAVRRMGHALVGAMLCLFGVVTAMGQSTTAASSAEVAEVAERDTFNVSRRYTKEHPLVYRDYADLPPYSFINADNAPDGFNVELVRMLMDDLGIPVRFELENVNRAYEDMRMGRNDLILSIHSPKRTRYGTYGKLPITIFTTSLLTPRTKPLPNVSRVRELGDNKVMVHTGSFSLDIMLERDMGANAIMADDMVEVIRNIAAADSGMVVWNTMTMKYMIGRYGLGDKLQLQPIHDLHTDLRFMSRDTLLLERVEQAFLARNGTPELMRLRQKWFYPETKVVEHPMLWNVLYFIGAFLIVALASFYYFKWLERQYARSNKRQNLQLSLYMRTSAITMWTYNVVHKQFVAFGEDGVMGEPLDSSTFGERFQREDFANLLLMIEQVASGEKETNHITLRLHNPNKEADSDYLYYDVLLSVLDRQTNGHPANILGTQTNITKERQRHIERQAASLKFRTAFNISNAWLVCFNRMERLTNINATTCSEFGITQPALLIDSGFNPKDLPFDISDAYNDDGTLHELWASTRIDFDQLRHEGKLSQYITARGVAYHEIIVMPVYDKEQQLIATYVAGLNITDSVDTVHESRQREQGIEALYNKAQQGMENLSRSLAFAQVRMGKYDPATRSLSLTMLNDAGSGENTLGALDLMTIVSKSSQRRVASCIKQLDKRLMRNFDFICDTRLRVSGGEGYGTYSVRIMPMPMPDNPDVALRYIILTRDVTQIVRMRRQLRAETNKAQEAEQIKNVFLRNMSSEIRRPVKYMLRLSQRLNGNACADEDEVPLTSEQIATEIYNTCRNLLALVGDILTLSKIEAGMVEVCIEQFDMAVLFPALCQMSASTVPHGGVEVQIESPYEKFVIETDSSLVGKMIEGMMRCSLATTIQGFVRVSYEYFNNMLVLRVEDTGLGMTPDQIKAVGNHRFSRHGGHYDQSIKLAIVKEQARLLHGDLYIESQSGHGTTAWVTLPCNTPPYK